MNKTLRIFIKDTRHLWPEILISLAVTAGFVATDHYAWSVTLNTQLQLHKDALRECLEVLMPISWWLLIARAVHDESPVGDRQFWITRPYGWQRVLSAKLLFIAAFICVPLFLSQLFLLHQAGLHPMLVLPRIAVLILFICGFILLPLLAFSAVTATLTRMFLIILGLIVYISLVAYCCFSLGTRPEMAPGNAGRGVFMIFLIPLAGLAVTLLQYIRRRTIVSVGILTATVVILTAVFVAIIFSTTHVNGYSVLASGETAPITASINPDPRFQTADMGESSDFDRSPSDSIIWSAVPVSVANAASGKAVSIEGEKVEYEANGVKGSLPWDTNVPDFVDPVSPSTIIVRVPYSAYKAIGDKPATFRVTFAVKEYDPEPARTAWFDGKTLDAPDNGHCVADPGTYDLQCRYALALPGPTLISWTQACTHRELSDTPVIRRWIGRVGGEISPGFSPVEYLSPENFNRFTLASLAPVCPGTWVTFTKYHVARKRLVQVTLPDIDLGLYRFPNKSEFQPILH